ncbi:hypothetical protein MJO28_009490 [Puccinia striiformis f. sp. tritici]|nr:hypothetical protein MJO28_009490 [Puccinia striiformis f. sp. tritici]
MLTNNRKEKLKAKYSEDQQGEMEKKKNGLDYRIQRNYIRESQHPLPFMIIQSNKNHSLSELKD